MNSTNQTADRLLACLRQVPPPELADQLADCSVAEWQALVALAIEQKAAPLLYHRLKAHGMAAHIPQAISQQLQTMHRANALRNMQIYHALDKVVNALQSEQIPVLVLKGAHLAATVYESIALRVMADTDILVPESYIMAAVTAIKALGYQPERPWLSLEAYLAHRHHVSPFLHPQAIASLELHWRVTPPNRPYHIPTEELWHRATPINVQGIATQGLCAEDLLLHICIHASYHHWFQQGIRSLCDIAELLRQHADSFDWEAFTSRTNEWGCQHGIFLTLSAAHSLLGVEVPTQVLTALQPADLTPFSKEEWYAFLFTEHRTSKIGPASHLWRFLKKPTLRSGMRLFGQRVFIPASELALQYAIPIDSPWRYFYYMVRAQDLLLRHLANAWRMYRGDPTMIQTVKQRGQLQHWLGAPEVT